MDQRKRGEEPTIGPPGQGTASGLTGRQGTQAIGAVGSLRARLSVGKLGSLSKSLPGGWSNRAATKVLCVLGRRRTV